MAGPHIVSLLRSHSLPKAFFEMKLVFSCHYWWSPQAASFAQPLQFQCHLSSSLAGNHLLWRCWTALSLFSVDFIRQIIFYIGWKSGLYNCMRFQINVLFLVWKLMTIYGFVQNRTIHLAEKIPSHVYDLFTWKLWLSTHPDIEDAVEAYCTLCLMSLL